MAVETAVVKPVSRALDFSLDVIPFDERKVLD